jgi:hypothetical protein
MLSAQLNVIAQCVQHQCAMGEMNSEADLALYNLCESKIEHILNIQIQGISPGWTLYVVCKSFPNVVSRIRSR